MSEISKCILCEKDAEKSGVQGKDGYLAECVTCGKYFLGSPGIFEGSYTGMPREKRAMISAYTRELFERGEATPEFGDSDALKEIITEYENKTLDEKLENLIWYIRKKSSQFGDSISWDAGKDYPITYSLSPEGFTKIRDLAMEKDLLDWPARGVGLRLKEEGWKMGTDSVSLKNDKEFKEIIIKAVHNANFSHYNGLYKNLEEEIVFEVTTAKGKKYIIVAHYWDPEKGLISEQVGKYFNRTRKSEIPYIIVTNASGLTQEACEDLEEFNKIFEEKKLLVIFGSNEDEFIKEFLNL